MAFLSFKQALKKLCILKFDALRRKGKLYDHYSQENRT